MANQENIRKWVEALRSGEYRQGKGHLTVVDDQGDRSYCCLGVACEISGVTEVVEQTASPNTGDPVLTWSGTIAYDRDHDEEDSIFFPPQEVLDWLGVDHYNPELEIEMPYGGSMTVDASEANDTHNRSFEEIADAIERKYLTAV